MELDASADTRPALAPSAWGAAFPKPMRNPTDLPITMEDEPPFTFDYIATLLRDFLALLGLFAIVGIAAFAWGDWK